jgi:phosphoribosylamine--glycine ligase
MPRSRSASASLDANSPGAVTDYANDEHIDLVIIGPEAPLVAGVADALRERGIPVFGPARAAASVTMTPLPAARPSAFTTYGAPYASSAASTSARVAARVYLPSGPVLVEEFLSGPEVSLFFVSDGDTVRALSPAQDFKRAYDGERRADR